MPSSNPQPTTQITLSEFCEPFFLEVGEVLRSTYGGVSAEPWPIRDRLKKRLDGLLEDSSRKYPWLEREYARIEWVLAVFADVVIFDSTLPFAKLWKEQVLLASDPRINIKDGRQRFFLELDAALRGAPSGAAERLAIFQTCLGLGFGGIHANDPGKLREYSEQILQRLDIAPDNRAAEGRMCPEAYQHTQTDRLHEPMAEKLLAIGIVCGALLLATLVTYVWIYVVARGEIKDALGTLAK
jgi:type VI protein secretion system component VasF